MQGDADNTGNQFRKTVRRRYDFYFAKAINDQHADDGRADDGTEI